MAGALNAEVGRWKRTSPLRINVGIFVVYTRRLASVRLLFVGAHLVFVLTGEYCSLCVCAILRENVWICLYFSKRVNVFRMFATRTSLLLHKSRSWLLYKNIVLTRNGNICSLDNSNARCKCCRWHFSLFHYIFIHRFLLVQTSGYRVISMYFYLV